MADQNPAGENDVDDMLPTSSAFITEREKLPEELWRVFDDLVLQYRYSALMHYSRPFVSYRILSDIVMAGWRRSAKPTST
jgi:hypothetical protein